MNEAETRAEHIDPALAAAGWGVVESSRIRREYPITLGRIEGHGRRGKALTADYVLIHRNHKLAVVEAKAWDEEVTEGVAQAKNYAGKLAIRYPTRPTGGASTASICRPARKAICRATRRRTNSGRRLSPRQTRGATALPPFHSRTRADFSNHAITRTLLLTEFWRPSPPRSRVSCSLWPPARARLSLPFRSHGSCLIAAGT
jgi:hypothetical protein